jgi:hypothetical protein
MSQPHSVPAVEALGQDALEGVVVGVLFGDPQAHDPPVQQVTGNARFGDAR